MFRRLLFGKEGVVATEFGLILPFMLTLLYGSFEVSDAVTLYLKLIAAADTITDLAAQAQPGQTLHSADIDNFYTAAQLVLAPSSGAGLGLAIASVTFDPTTGTPSVAWQQTRGGAGAMTNAASSSTGLGNPGDSVIVANVTYTFNSPLKYVIHQPIVITQRTYARPRLVVSIPYS